MDDPFIQVIKKILGFIFSLVLIATIVFVIFRVLPSDPVSLMFRHYPGNDVAEFWRHNLGLDKSLPEQYATWLVGAFTGQFGISAGFAPREPIAAILPPYLGKTLILFSVITGISLFLGAILGRFVAKREDRPVDSILSRFAAVFFSAPAFLVTLIIVTTMAALSPGWPFQGSTSDSFYWMQLDPIGQALDVLAHAFIPVSAVVIPSTAMMMLIFRKGALDQIRDSVPHALESGEMPKANRVLHSFFGPLSKTMPLVMMALAWIMVGVIAVEFIMTYKGIGYLLWESVMTLDIPLMMAVIFFLLFIVISACFLIDMVVWIMTLEKEPISFPAAIVPQTIGTEETVNLQTSAGNVGTPKTSPSLLGICSSIFSQLLRRPVGAIAAILLVVMFAIAVVGPFIAPENPTSLVEPGYVTDQPQPPGGDHILGTDYKSKDVFSQMLWGGWPIMLIGIAVVTISALLGTFFGIIAGSLIRILDAPLMVIADLLTAIPAFIILLAFVVVYGRTEWIPVMMITLLAVGPVARSVRDALVSRRAEESGDNVSRLPTGISQSVTHDIIPKAIPGMLSSLKFVVVIAMLTTTFLDFFGLGDPNVVSWGWMLERAHDASAMIYGYWWLILPPIAAIMIACASFYFVIDALENITRKMFDRPRKKSSNVKLSISATPPHGSAQP